MAVGDHFAVEHVEQQGPSALRGIAKGVAFLLMRAGVTIAAALSLLAATPVQAAIIPGGNLTTQTWTLANSPYIVTGDATVLPGQTLTIEAGVDVQFASADGQGSGLDTTKVEMTINGSLDVQGTVALPVTFHAQSGTGNGVWYGIIANSATSLTVSNAHFSNTVRGLRTPPSSSISDVVFDTASEFDLVTSAMGTASNISGSLSASKVSGPLQVSGSLSHSNSPGQFSMAGNFAIAGAVPYHLRLVNTSLFDSMQATGTVALGFGEVLLDLDATGLVASPGDSFRILDKTSAGAISGTFFAKAEGTQFQEDGYMFQITYAGGVGGNDIVLLVVPEPNASLLLASVVVPIICRRRRRAEG